MRESVDYMIATIYNMMMLFVDHHDDTFLLTITMTFVDQQYFC